MSSPYLIYRTPQETGEYTDSRLAAAEVAAEGAERRSIIKAYTDVERIKGRIDVELLKQNVAARKNLLDNQQKTAKLFSDLQAALNKVNAQNYGNAAKAAAAYFETATDGLVDLVGQMHEAPADVVQMFNQAKITSPDAAWQATAGTFNVLGQRGESARQHGVIDYQIRETLGDNVNYTEVATPQLLSMLRGAGLDEATLAMAGERIEDARRMYSAGRMAQDEVTRSASTVKGLIGKEGLLREDVDAQIARARQGLALASQKFEEFWQVSPDQVREQLVEDQRSLQEYNTLSNRSDELYELAFGARRPQSAEAELGLLLDDPEFRAWAEDNNLGDIGAAIKNKDGEVVGARPGRDLAMAFQRYKYQQRNPNQWGMFGRPGGGQFTGEVVKVTYVPKEAPMAGATPDGQAVLRFGDNYYQREGGEGRFVKVDPKVAKGVNFRLVVKPDYQPLSEADLAAEGFDPDTLMVANEDSLEDQERMKAVYATSKYGERVRLHASQMDTYAGKGYTAIIDDQTGQMEIISGEQLPTIQTVKATEDSTKAQRRAVRRYLSGAAAVDELAPTKDKGLQRRYGGVEVRQGELEPDGQMTALLERVASRQAEIPDFTLPGPSAALAAADGKADKQAAAAALLARRAPPAADEDSDIEIAPVEAKRMPRVLNLDEMELTGDPNAGLSEDEIAELARQRAEVRVTAAERKAAGIPPETKPEPPVIPSPEPKGRLPSPEDQLRRAAAEEMMRKAQQQK